MGINRASLEALNIDFDLLHKQKRTLMVIAEFDTEELHVKEVVHLAGLIEFIDSIQDKAVEEGLWIYPQEMHPQLMQMDIRTSRTGSIKNISYSQLKEILGHPNVEDDPLKVDASWAVQHEDERKLWVWNSKNGPAYTGKGSIEDINNWSMGGDKSLACELFGESNVY